jgi:hypothetical protein
MRIFLAFAAASLGTLLLVPVLMFAAPFWLVAACTRALSRLFEPAYLTRDQLIEFDPVFGWKPRANLKTHHLMADVFQISTDADGWRGRSSLADSDIVVFGDSFAAGYGVSDDELFANLRSRPRVKPIGIGGYSMVQELLWMQRLASGLRGKLVVWFVYFGNDLYDNLSPDLRGYRKPFVREVRGTGDWEICSDHINPDKWPIVTQMRLHAAHHLPKLAELCSTTFLSLRAYGACEFLIRQGKQLCDVAGAELVVLTIPEVCQLTPEGHRYLQSFGRELKEFDPDLPDVQVKSICNRLDVPFLAGKSFLDVTCYKLNDVHWNALGHHRVASALAALHAAPRRRAIGIETGSPEKRVLSGGLNPVAKSASW